MGLVYTLATGALLLLGQDAIMHLFTNDETVVFFGEAAMHWFCPFYFLLSILHGLAGAVRGTGASVPPMVVLLVSLCLFRIVWIQWLLPLFSGIDGVFILVPGVLGHWRPLMILYGLEGQVDGISRIKKSSPDLWSGELFGHSFSNSKNRNAMSVVSSGRAARRAAPSRGVFQ